MTTTQSIITIVAVVLGTMVTRFLPFLIFPEGKTPPAYIQYLGKVLPYAVIGLLVIYCLKDVPASSTYGLPEAIAILFIMVLHKWKKNTLLSIGGGTILYMILVCCCPHELSLTCSHESSSDCLTFCHQSLQGCRLTTGGNKDYVVMVPSISCSTTYLII